LIPHIFQNVIFPKGFFLLGLFGLSNDFQYSFFFTRKEPKYRRYLPRPQFWQKMCTECLDMCRSKGFGMQV
jgi:hypothetical protein